MFTNISVKHSDTRIFMNIGRTTLDNESIGLGFLCKYYYYFIGYIDSKQVVKNICASKKYQSM